MDLSADLAVLTALNGVTTEHPQLPELMSRSFTDAGLYAQPYLPTRPITALLAWVDALPGHWTTHAIDAPGGEGTQLFARGRLADREIVLSVVTWRLVPATRADGMVTREQLRHLSAQEVSPGGVLAEATPEPVAAGTP